MGTLLQDLRYAVRILAKSPGFTIIAVLTLALGIGASTAIFGVVNALVLRELPVRDPGRLVSFYTTNQNGEWNGIGVSQLEEIERQQTVFSGIFGKDYPNNSNVEVQGEVWPINLGEVTGEYYSVLGINPWLGRLIAPDDVALSRGAPTAVAVLSYDFWQRQYARNPDVIGKTILIAKAPFTIIGVTPKGFFGEQVGFSLDVTIPITEIPGAQPNSRQSLGCRLAAGRLRDGVSFEQARAQLETLWPAIRVAALGSELNPKIREDLQKEGLHIEPYPKNGFSYLRDRFSKPLYVLMGIAGLILLIACVNLATLLLARASARRYEMGIRITLGASRWRLMRQLLTESLVVSISGAVLGLAFENSVSEWLVRFWNHIPFNPPTSMNLKPDFHVLIFVLAVTMLAGILFGIAPAWLASHGAPAGALQEGSRAGGRNMRRFGKLLITAQLALSLALIVTGGLFAGSLEKIRAIRPGFDYRHVAIMQLHPRADQKTYEDSYFRNLVQDLSALPGVRSAALSQMLPGAGFGGLYLVGRSNARNEASVSVDFQIISPEFFQTMKIGFVRGQNFTWQDNEHTPRVAVISASLAKELFPSGDSIGQSIRIGTELERQNVQILGVVNDARVKDIREKSPFAVYVPCLQEPKYMGYWTNVELLTAGQAGAVLEAARQQVESLGQQYVFNSKTLEEVIDGAIANERVTAFMSGFFSVLALLIAVIGLEGLMSYMVIQRTREIGVRMALGAQPKDVLKMIIGEGMLLAGMGIVVGIGGALALGRLVESLLFEIKPTDPATFIGVAILLAIVAFLACYIPARRAMRVDPMVALRYE